jgi:hypothetical protein
MKSRAEIRNAAAKQLIQFFLVDRHENRLLRFTND